MSALVKKHSRTSSSPSAGGRSSEQSCLSSDASTPEHDPQDLTLLCPTVFRPGRTVSWTGLYGERLPDGSLGRRIRVAAGKRFPPVSVAGGSFVPLELEPLPRDAYPDLEPLVAESPLTDLSQRFREYLAEWRRERSAG